MSKIDLHFHTNSHKSGEKRNFDFKKLSEEVKKANIGVLAITNHNYFDSDSYEKFCANFNIDLIFILRGVELDVTNRNEKRHTIILFDENFDSNEINEISNKFKDKEFNDLLLFIEENNFHKRIIVYPHSSKKDKGFPIIEMKTINTNIKNNHSDITLLWDLNSVKDDFVELTNEYYNLPSTDASSMDDYVSKVNGLFNLIKKPKNFEDMINLIHQKKLYKIREKKSQIKIGEVPIKISEGENKDKEIGSIELFGGLNVILGRRGTGKTELLQQIKNYCESSEIKFEDISSKDESEFKDVQNELFSDHCNVLRGEISKINTTPNDNGYVKFDEMQIDDFISLKNEQLQSTEINDFIKKAKIISSETVVEITKEQTNIPNLQEILESAKNFVTMINEYDGDFQKIKNFNFEKISKLIEEISKEILKINLEKILPSKLAENMQKNIKAYFSKYNKSAIKLQDEIGIKKYWNSVWKQNYVIARKRNNDAEKIKKNGTEQLEWFSNWRS